MEEQGTSLLNNITGFLFFGVPHQGMAMGSLIPLVEDHSNLSLLESLNENSPLLPRLENDFKNAFGTSHPRIVSFYETEKSATALRVCHY
jgi:hypothetical protein